MLLSHVGTWEPPGVCEGSGGLSRQVEEAQQGSMGGGDPWAASLLTGQCLCCAGVAWARTVSIDWHRHTYVFQTTGGQAGEVWGWLGPQGRTWRSSASDSGCLASSPPPPPTTLGPKEAVQGR